MTMKVFKIKIKKKVPTGQSNSFVKNTQTYKTMSKRIIINETEKSIVT